MITNDVYIIEYILCQEAEWPSAFCPAISMWGPISLVPIHMLAWRISKGHSLTGEMYQDSTVMSEIQLLNAVSIYDNDLETVDAGCSLDEVELGQGDAMWFSPTWYQTVSPYPISCDFVFTKVFRLQDSQFETAKTGQLHHSYSRTAIADTFSHLLGIDEAENMPQRPYSSDLN